MSHFEFKPGVKYIVIKAFEDFDGEMVKVGEHLTFASEDFFVYDDGYTYNFQERTIRLRGVEAPHIPDHLADYFRPAHTDDWSREGVTLAEEKKIRKPRRLRRKK